MATRRSGSRARRQKSVFTKGNTYTATKNTKTTDIPMENDHSCRKILRLSKEMQERVDNSPIVTEHDGCDLTSPMLLRPSETEEPPILGDEEYRILAPIKLLDLVNTTMNVHNSTTCKGHFEWDELAEDKRGVCWSMGLRCTLCKYRSGKHKLYYEVPSKRGRPAATANVGLQVGLAQNMISNTAMRQIFMCMNIVPPSYASMQKQANTVGETIIKCNEDDMHNEQDTIKHIQECRGTKNQSIAAEGDGRYNNALWSGGGKTPFQPATQMVYTVSENVSSSKKIIGVYTGNKLCKQATRLRSQGHKDVKCPDHRGKCTANLKETDSIGDEARGLKHIVENLKPGLNIGAFTADGDSKAHTALSSTCTVYRDVRHFGKSLKKQIENAKFSDQVFPSHTKAGRTVIQKRFAADLTKRCNAEFHRCHKETSGDASKLKARLTYITDAIVLCYSGDCSLCKKYSLVCNGRTPKFLLKPGVQLNFSSPDDDYIIRQCLHYRFGSHAVDLTEMNTNTQKSESVNRTYSKTNPKIVTWSRNFPARIHSAVHLRNNGFQQSTMKKMHAVGVPPCARVQNYIRTEERAIQQRLKYSMSVRHRQNSFRKIQRLYRLYDKHNEWKEDYKKNIAMPKLKKHSKTDHSYCK